MLPTQIAVEEAVAFTVGLALTVNEMVFVFTHPLALVPVTLYIVVETGFTDVLVATIFTGFQV